MKLERLKQKWPLLMAAAFALVLPLSTVAEDIDIFVGSSGGGGANVLVILDNTSNWSDNAHKWPNGLLQGQAELQALINLVPTLDASINLGLMIFNQNGGDNCCSGGYIRYAMQPMNKTNRDALLAVLNDLYVNITDPSNKAASNASYSMALFDAFKYFGGYTSPVHATDNVAGAPQNATQFGPAVFATPPSTFSKPDPLGYVLGSNYTVYSPPAAAADVCGSKNYIVFVGNTVPNSDTPPSEDMSLFLKGVNDYILPSQYQLNTFTTTTTTKQQSLGNSSACYANSSSGLNKCTSDNANTCGASYDTCTCVSPSTTTGCSGGQVKYTISGGTKVTTVTPTSSTCAPGAPGCGPIRYADEWTNFLYRTDVNAASGQQNISTFTIDAFTPNKQDADQTALLYSMAYYGGGPGDYYAASNQNAINVAFGDIFAKIQATSSTFVSASLPVSATNRALNANEVYIGMFRPDASTKPLWLGNMKRYEIGNDFGLADFNGKPAVETLHGFFAPCATSWWTSDSGKYWTNFIEDPSPTSLCTPAAGNAFDRYSDSPDGPQVEKGSVAEVIRRGNNPASPTWALNRTLYTNGFQTFNAANSGMAAVDVDFIRGLNVDPAGTYQTYQYDPADPTKTTTIRPTVHGDVVHSRPLAINYPSGQTVIYYGANDGTLRAVESAEGKELWAYVAPEFYATLPRLRQDSPLIRYSFANPLSGSTPKNYYFDGSMGVYQNSDSSKVWVYPTMRRGGRMVYALNVNTPSAPSLMWKVGCPNLTDDTNCSSGFSAIGQTWSTPNVATLKIGGTVGEAPIPIVAVGGGYDNCEDSSPNAACAGAKGSIVYILRADNGSRLASFTTAGRVVADVVFVDLDSDGIPDLAYAVDTRGDIYRISFGFSKSAPLAAASWTSTLIAATTGSNRKFLYAPAVSPAYDNSTGKFYVYLALGSGDREQPLDTQYPYANPVLNRFYMYIDDIASTVKANLDSTAMSAFTAAQSCATSLVIPGSGKSGWFMDLDVCGPGATDCTPGATTRGEQTVTSAVIVGGFVAFSTNRAIPRSANVCAPQGEARGYAVNLLNASGVIGAQPNTCGGDRSGPFVGGGLPPSPVVNNVNVDGKVETIGIGVVCLSGCASAGVQSQRVFNLPPQPRTRVYWRQEGDN